MYTGPPGPPGDTGAVGATGATGATGDVGATGNTGPKGDTGRAGAAGPQGLRGPKGQKGPVGSTGESGDVGVCNNSSLLLDMELYLVGINPPWGATFISVYLISNLTSGPFLMDVLTLIVRLDNIVIHLEGNSVLA